MPFHCTLAATVYTYKDADGNTVFTDQARPGARRIDVTPTNSVESTPKPVHRVAPSAPPPPVQQQYQMLRILTPLPDTSVQQEDGAMIVTLASDPALYPGNYYRVLIDDNPAGDPSPSPVFPLQNIDRGAHQLSAEIIDDRGHVIERTPNQPFFMQRISLSQKRRVHPCQTADYGVRPECPLSAKPADD
nr:DUF4124 domain-containing protein [Pseudomonas sp. dw_358]